MTRNSFGLSVVNRTELPDLRDPGVLSSPPLKETEHRRYTRMRN